MNKASNIQIGTETLMGAVIPMALASKSGELQMVNARLEQQLKVEPGLLVGTHLQDWVENIDQILFTSSFETRIKNKIAWETTLVFKFSDQNRISLKSRIVPVSTDLNEEGHFLILPHEFISEKPSSNRLLRDKKILEEVNRNLNEGIYRSNEDGQIIYANNAMLKIFGYKTIEEIQKIHLNQVYVDSTKRQQVLQKLEQLGEVINEEVLLKRKDGSIFWGLLGTTRSIEENGMVVYDGAVRDVSTFKELENRLRHEKQKAEEAAADKEQFLSMMSHELRTPMNAVIGISDLLLRDKPADHQIENLKTLQFSAESLLHLINDILDYSKIEAGMVEFESITFNFIELIEKIFESFRLKANSKQLGYELEIGDTVPEHIKADPLRISQILNNLISNAFKFTFEGKVKLMVEALETSGPDFRIQFKVIDTGIGIEKSGLQNIFDAFAQANSSTSRQFGGTGLGLTITKKLVEQMGGEVQVKSQPGFGSEFEIKLFFEQPEENASDSDMIPENPDFLGLKILIVEDNRINQVVLEKYLTMWNADVLVAENGTRALEVFMKNDVDLVLMDLQMPEMDGFVATKKILEYCQKNQKPSIPIIAVTASTVSEVKEQIKTAGMVDYVRKPFSPKELLEKIDHYSNRPKPEA